MQAMTSFTLHTAFKKPGTRPHTAPASIAPSRQASHNSGPGMNVHFTPIRTATYAPTMNWPDAPMLNRPVLLAKPTERPVRMMGVAAYSTCPRFFMSERPPVRMASRPQKAWAGSATSSTTKPTTRPHKIARSEAIKLEKPAFV